MRSFHFPNMFAGNNANIWKTSEYLEATKQNAEILLQCRRGELFGDPYFGVTLEQFLFDQNNAVLREAVIDVIYTQLALFLPQVRVNRKDISIIQDKEKGKIYCKFSGISQIDYQNNTYNLLLYQNTEE